MMCVRILHEGPVHKKPLKPNSKHSNLKDVKAISSEERFHSWEHCGLEHTHICHKLAAKATVDKEWNKLQNVRA